jgi:phage tail-like protein
MADEYIIQLRITGPEGMAEIFVVPPGRSIIGRQEGNPVRLDSPLISRQHAQLDCTAAGCQITDLGSANGTVLNGERLEPQTPATLNHGSLIEIGPYSLAYEQIRVASAAAVKPPPAKATPRAPEKKATAAPPVVEPEAQSAKPPPPAPPSIPPASLVPVPPPPPDYSSPPPGLEFHSQRLINYLPGIYHSDFASRYLAIFEAIITPIEWNIDNFDLFLDPDTAPDEFLPWLANWFEIPFDSTWSSEQRRILLSEAGEIYARRGTRWALSRVLEIYTGCLPVINDTDDNLPPFTFKVRLALPESMVDRKLVEQIIDSNKPAHANYVLELMPG